MLQIDQTPTKGIKITTLPYDSFYYFDPMILSFEKGRFAIFQIS